MLAILKKEISYFFSSTIGYLFISLFLFTTGTFLWVIHSNYNILDSGFASLTPFFEIAPMVFLLLIPALCMQAFAEEKKQGTLELLLTKPISVFRLILGKYLGVFCIVFIAILPTFIYVYVLHQLAFPIGEIDYGSIFGSYIALLLLAASYTAIGIFASSISSNQTLALLISLLFCFIGYFGLNNLQGLGLPLFSESIGMAFHYNRISEGVLDTRDLFYFISICCLFLGGTFYIFRKQKAFINIKKTVLFLGGIIVLLFIGNHYYQRFDLTQDKRFSLSKTSRELLFSVTKPITIEVLLAGNLPSEFKRLQRETKQILESFAAQNKNINFVFTNPLTPKELRTENLNELNKIGLTPIEVSTKYEGVLKKEIIVPWAIAYFENKTAKIPLLKNKLGASTSERINSSVQNLEYTFTNSIKQIITSKNKKIAILKGNGQLSELFIADYLKSIQKYYRIAPFTLDSVATQPIKTLEKLKKYDLIINAKPIEAFSENEKLVLDQHLLYGGKQLLLIDAVAAEKDSLFNNSKHRTLAWNRDLRLNDLLFAYGIRINPKLINDYYSAPIIMAKGSGSNTQYTPYRWGFSSLSKSTKKHILTTNLEAVKFNFASPIDTLKNNIQKTILLESSSFTKLQGTPSELNLARITTERPIESYTKGSQILSVLLEGKFNSTYKNRVLPFEIKNFKETGINSKLVIISDGDVIKNEVSKQQPLELGFDPITKQQYGNKEFLLNITNYLLGDKGLVNLRAKQLKIPVLDLNKVSKEKIKHQFLALLLPWLIISFLYGIFFWYRKKKYAI